MRPIDLLIAPGIFMPFLLCAIVYAVAYCIVAYRSPSRAAAVWALKSSCLPAATCIGIALFGLIEWQFLQANANPQQRFTMLVAVLIDGFVASAVTGSFSLLLLNRRPVIAS